MPERKASSRGFTLIEMMAVIIILGILAAVAIGAYTKQVRNAHKSEVISDLSNLILRQKSFLGVSGHYASSTNCEGGACTYPDMPAITAATGPVAWDVMDAAFTMAAGAGAFFRGGGDVHGFDALRFMPEGGNSLCGYATISGHGARAAAPNNDTPALGSPIVDDIFPMGTDPYFQRDWFYAYALCDFDYDGEYWAFTTAHYESNVNYSNIPAGPYTEGE